MSGLQNVIVAGEPVPFVQIVPTLVDATASLGVAYVQALTVSLIGALLGRTYTWTWISGGAGITLTGVNSSTVVLTSVSLVPVTRTGTLRLQVTGPVLSRTYDIPVTIRHL